MPPSSKMQPVKEVLFFQTALKTPPISEQARNEAGRLLRRLQKGENFGMPQSRPMPSIGAHVHELRVRDAEHNWRIIYRIDGTVILVVEIFAKKTDATPKKTIKLCQQRFATFDAICRSRQ